MSNLTLFQELEELLRPHSQYTSEDGVMLKNSIVEAALQLRPDLLKLILTNEKLKANFFTEVESMLVFDKVRFQKFVMNKRFLPDSYTSFKNKIGLTTDDGDFLAESREVVLSWPYKDCVLEGGQTKEDAKRNEVFWNEILAPDEINRLTEPKVLTNFKKFDADGEHKVQSISKADNLIIKGNNLLALHSLKKTYAGQVKLIYIDPPYNTGNDSFQYNDNFNHSSWLTFMRNRLEAAKDLLKRDGVICVHCDENEQGYLKVLMDSVFNQDNYINSIVIKTKTAGVSGTHAGKSFQKSHETIHVYTKNFNEFQFVEQQYLILPFEDFLKQMNDEDVSFKYTSVLMNCSEGIYFKTIKDGYGNDIKVYKVEEYETKSINRIASEENISEIEAYKKYYTRIFTTENAQTSIRTRVQEATGEDECMYYIEYYPTSGKNKGTMTTIHFVGAKKRLVSWFTNVTLFEKNELYKKEKLGTLWDKLNWNNVTREGGVSFPNGQKPEQLIKLLTATFTDENDIVLDYHLGSGTTSAVALKMNRKFIGVEQLDYDDNDSVERLKNVIGRIETKPNELMPFNSYDQTGISKAVNWQGGGSFIYCELAKANQEFADKILASDNKEELSSIWIQMQETGFLSWKINPKTINANAEVVSLLSVEDTQKFLLEALDKNLLYIPYSEIDNQEFGISEDDKQLNAKFYGKA